MKIKAIYIIPFLLLFGCKKDEGRELPQSAQYNVFIQLNWNNTDFPTDYPSNPHFSRFIGWSHNQENTFFKEGTLASVGIKDMAERGKVSPLDNELDSLIKSGLGHQYFIGSNLASGIGEVKLELLEVTKSSSNLSLVSMLAPSPDWYVGVLGVELVDNNEFIEEKTVDIVVYDAGTDSGVSYTSNDSITFPQQNITKFISEPLGNGTTLNKIIGTVRFVKQAEK